ncbi:MAG TPA: hypothetical protein VG222_05215, partial [Vicinamibacterales bacterium]|nr:hypothetical protein [Vicinamibacterales bacterium]
MILRRLLLAAATVAAVSSSGALAHTDSPPTVPAALSDFFKPGIVLQDKNGDGVVDFVNARIVLAEHPSSFEVSAAADIASRLGFETSAMNLPMARRQANTATGSKPEPVDAQKRLTPGVTDEGQPAVFVGAGALAGSPTTPSALGAAALKPGDGIVAAFGSAGRPSVAIAGADGDGLTAAAVMLSGHLPFVWDQKGPTVDTVAADVCAYLTGHGAAPVSTIVPAVFVHSGLDAADRVIVDVGMATRGDVVRAQLVLSQLKVDGARNPKRALSYAAARALRVHLQAAGTSATVELPRVRGTGLRTQPLPRRPGGAKATFDLSSFYANDGALGDSDNNLIPDRVEVLLSPDGAGSEGVIDLAARLGLESTGVSVPIAKSAAAITAPDTEPMLVLIGVSHPLVTTLIEDGKWQRPALQPGEGLIQVVRKA